MSNKLKQHTSSRKQDTGNDHMFKQEKIFLTTNAFFVRRTKKEKTKNISKYYFSELDKQMHEEINNFLHMFEKRQKKKKQNFENVITCTVGEK